MSDKQTSEAAELEEARVLAEVYLLADDDKLTLPARMFRQRLAYAIRAVVREGSISTKKRSYALSCLGGVLVVKAAGYGEQNGRGYFALDESDLQWQAKEKGAGYTSWIDVQKSELIALRDFLNARFPVAK